ncbi:hypothetical protein OIU34_08605 [Pararhizobium sp. BT-229]|uniref:hypothetical protein n=1 Tax=Pararhizobium sp. BT-229 TaxID=2986923 RepID=UPI0021F6AB69|nr:hypothetical protein [Pararhizobium sp. BT-229]MCV9961961.1 hypothetical protein [Pararhizobium sp. BT-229]
MSVSRNSLEGLVTLIIDRGESASHLRDAFSRAGALVFVVQDSATRRYLPRNFIPHIAVIDPETIEERELRALAYGLVSDLNCHSIIYSSMVPEQSRGLDDLVHKSATPSVVVDVAVSALDKRCRR